MNNGKQKREEKKEIKNDINKYRRKKNLRKNKIRFALIALGVLVIILIIANWRTVFAPFKDIWLKRGDGGFPVTLPGSTQYDLGEMGENFYLLTDTYLYTYDKDGAELAGIQHKFQNPAGVANSKRVMVYDKNGTSFRMYSRTGEVFSNNLEDVIVFGQIGNDERCAVVTTSTRYSNYLCVFNGAGRQIFRWASPDEKIMGVCFGDGDKCVYVSVVGEKNGELLGNIVKFDLSVSESEVWRVPVGENITYSLKLNSDGVYAVTSSGAMVIDEQSGEIKASNFFSGSIYDIPDPDGLCAVIFRDSATNKETVVAYDDTLQPTNSITPDNDISACDISGGRLYLLISNYLTEYDASLKEIGKYELDDEYSNVKIINGYAYLLGYNTVQRVKL